MDGVLEEVKVGIVCKFSVRRRIVCSWQVVVVYIFYNGESGSACVHDSIYFQDLVLCSFNKK